MFRDGSDVNDKDATLSHSCINLTDYNFGDKVSSLRVTLTPSADKSRTSYSQLETEHADLESDFTKLREDKTSLDLELSDLKSDQSLLELKHELTTIDQIVLQKDYTLLSSELDVLE